MTTELFSPQDYLHAADLILQRTVETAKEPTPGFPHYADQDTGVWTRSTDGDWTAGFFVGQLWLAAACRHDGAARNLAMNWSRELERRVESQTIFRGFLFWYGAALGDMMLAEQQPGRLALRGAQALAGSFHSAAKLLPLGPSAEEAHSVGFNETNIDGFPGGMPLLHWAADRTGNQELRDKGRSHAAQHVRFCVRKDGSVVQSATFDERSGDLTKTYTHKGIADDSTWARAQAWAMLGLAQAAHRERDIFTSDAIRVCNWWVEHMPANGVSYWDFDAPSYEERPLVDTSATAIAAAALLKMRSIAAEHAERYDQAAQQMVTTLVKHHLTPTSQKRSPPAGILGDGCYNQRLNLATRNELVWGTYFLTEALLTLGGALDNVRL